MIIFYSITAVQAGELQRKFPEINYSVDTIWGDASGRFRSIHSNGTETMFHDSEILKVHQPNTSFLLKNQSDSAEIFVGPFGQHILLQQGIRACTAAASCMLMLDAGIRDADWGFVFNTNIGSSILSDIESSGLKARERTAISPQSRMAVLAAWVDELGPGILSVSTEIGGHVILVDSLSLKDKTAIVRDPWHGWQITVTADALRRRMGNAVHLIQLESKVQIAPGSQTPNAPTEGALGRCVGWMKSLIK